MSSKKNNMETKNKSAQSRKNRRRSTRNASITNGDGEDAKEKCVKRPRDINSKDNNDYMMDFNPDSDVYKEIIDLVPSPDLNCSPADVPALPGTRVNLHGVILHETQGGLIVLNVRWRNKVYSGALIDAEKNKWATDRISNDRQMNEDNKQFQAPPPIKKLRIPTANASPADDSDSGNNKKKLVSPTTPSKNVKAARGNGKKRGTQDCSPTQSEDTAPAKKSKGRIMYNGEHLYECLEPNCEKKYKNKNGLSYHLRTMHPTKVEANDDSGKENKSDSRDESDSGDDNFVIDEKVDEESKDGDSEEKSNVVEEQNGSQSDEGEEEKKEELTENEKQIDRLKIEAEKVQAVLSNMKQKVEGADDIKQEIDPPEEMKPIPNLIDKEDIKIEEGYDKNGVEKKVENNEGETAEPLVDVESDAFPNYQWKNDAKGGNTPTSMSPSLNEKQTPVPMITVEPTATEEESTGDDKKDHPKGSSRTIIHEDHLSSLNELFAPTQTFHQYSPTLTSLNPQKINESLTDALSKQTTASSMNTVTSTQSTIENHPEPLKEALAAKPSIEISRHVPPIPSIAENRMPIDLLKNELAQSSNDYVACSDEERSISPENALTGCHKTFPQEERDMKTTKPNLLMYMNPLFQTMIEQNILGQAHLRGRPQRNFDKSLLFKDLASKGPIAAANMNNFQGKTPISTPGNSNMMLQDLTQVSNADQMTLASSSNATVSSSTDVKPGLSYESAAQAREYPMKPSLLEQRLLAHTPPVKSEMPGNVNGNSGSKGYPQNNSFDSSSQSREYPLKPSLLEQRLLAETIKTETPSTAVTSGSKMFLQPSISAGLPLTRPGGKSEDINKNDNTEKVPISSSFAVNRDPSEKNKATATSLRINPPTSSMEERVQIGTHTWFPEVVNDTTPSFTTPDYYNTPPIVSSSFRIPVTKTYPSYSAQSAVNSPSAEQKNPKNIAKRALQQPVPIAPAPAPVMQLPRTEFTAPSGEYASSPNGEKEQPQMSRFTLTSDKRLIPSPAENRGRPRKVRVEKTKQIPIGTAQDIAKVRGPTETSLPRKPSSSPVVRTSVIQGSLHPGLDGSPKPPDRNPEGHMIFPQGRDMRTFEVAADERERYAAHEKDLKPPMDIRNTEKYQGIGSPPGMYYSPTVGRGLLSPPLPRSASHSPRSADVLSRPVDVLTRPGDPTMPRSSPGGHPDMFNSKAQFQMALERIEKYNNANNPGPEHARNLLEHSRRKPELLRPMPDSHHDNRKHPLSPLSETLHVMQAYARAHELERDQRMAEYLGGSGRYQPPPGHRGDFGQARADGPRSMFDHRISSEESEQARLHASRERYIQQQNSLSNRPNVYRGSPPSHGTPQPSHHSANLVLGTADGSIIGPLSTYENRPPDHKR